MMSRNAARHAQRHALSGVCLLIVTVSVPVRLAVAEPPPEPLPVPEYSFDVESPTVSGSIVSASDVLTLAFPSPEVAMPGSALGLFSSLDDLDALSGNNASTPMTKSFALLFSVDRESKGAIAPDPYLVDGGYPYNVFDQAGRGHAAGDQFFTTELFSHAGSIRMREDEPDVARRNHYMVRNNFDEGGTDFSADPPTHADDDLEISVPQDCVDATAHLEHSESDGTILSAYFSLSADSPSLPLLSGGVLPSGASIFVSAHDAGPTGACCRSDGTCTLTTAAGCTDGMWLGSGATCDMCGGLSWTGACCFENSSCAIMSVVECIVGFGLWLGPDTTCDLCSSCPEPFGACCQADGTCAVTSAESCNDGLWLGPDTTCDMCGILWEPGACCRGNGSCDTTLMDGCFDGLWLGPFTTCDLCEGFSIPGACCLGDGSCAYMPLLECASDPAGGFWVGPYSTCEMCDFPPPPPGACCGYDGACAVTTPEACVAGDWLGPQTSCGMCGGGPGFLGACCYDNATCAITNEFECFSSYGWWLGPDSTCEMCGFPYPSDGACCYSNATCASTKEVDCFDTGGFWLGPETSCGMCGFPPSPSGACCFGDGTCSVVSDILCFNSGGAWLGPDTTCEMCGPASPADGACCYPDGSCVMLPADLCFISGGLSSPFAVCLGDGNGDGADDVCGAPGGNTSTTLYASYEQLGLRQDDDIDGLIVFDLDENGLFDGEDFVLFSLSPDSPSLTSIPGASPAAAAADVFRVAVGAAATTFASAGELGLGNAMDNLDALDFMLCGDSVARSEQHGIRATSDSRGGEAEGTGTERPKVATPDRGDSKTRSEMRPTGDLRIRKP